MKKILGFFNIFYEKRIELLVKEIEASSELEMISLTNKSLRSLITNDNVELLHIETISLNMYNAHKKRLFYYKVIFYERKGKK